MAYADNLLAEEGWRDKVYLDTEGNPTAGMGHKLTNEENLKYSVGDTIPNPMLLAWQNQDQTKARDAAIEQARKMKISDPKIIDALTSVNFQLGTDWERKFPNAVDSLMSGDLKGAADHFQWKDPNNKDLGKSKWAEQTPSRVDNLVSSLTDSSSSQGNAHLQNLASGTIGSGNAKMGTADAQYPTVNEITASLERDRGPKSNLDIGQQHGVPPGAIVDPIPPGQSWDSPFSDMQFRQPNKNEDFEGVGVGSGYLNQIPMQTSDWASSAHETPSAKALSFRQPADDLTSTDLPWMPEQDPKLEEPQERSFLNDAMSMIPNDVKAFGLSAFNKVDNLIGAAGEKYSKYVDNKNEMARQAAHQERYGNLGANQPGAMGYQEPIADPNNQQFNPETGQLIGPDPNNQQFDPATGLKLGPDGKPILQDEGPIALALAQNIGSGVTDAAKNISGYNLGKTYSDFGATPSHEFWNSPLAAIGNFGKNVAYNLPVVGPGLRATGDRAKQAYNWADLQYNKGNWGGGR